MDKFTPGPWERRHGSLEKNGKTILVSKANVSYTHGWETEESVANGNLISAAPDNYSAHEYLLDGLIKLLNGVPVRDIDERIAASQAALAKARGE